MVHYGRQAYIEELAIFWLYVRGAIFIYSDGSKEGLKKKKGKKTARKYEVMLF